MDSFLIIFTLNKTGCESPALVPGHRERGVETKVQLPGVPESGARLLQAVGSLPSLSINSKLRILEIHSLMHLDVCAHTWNEHHNELSHRPGKSQCGFEISPSSPSCPASLPDHAATDGLSVLLQMSLCFLESQLWGITQYLYCLAFSLSSNFSIIHSVLLPGIAVTFYCWLVLHCMDGCTTVCFSIHLLTDLWVISLLGQSQVKLLWGFCKDVCSFLVGKHLWEEWFGPIIWVRLTLRYFQTGKRSMRFYISTSNEWKFHLLHIFPYRWCGQSF